MNDRVYVALMLAWGTLPWLGGVFVALATQSTWGFPQTIPVWVWWASSGLAALITGVAFFLLVRTGRLNGILTSSQTGQPAVAA